MKKKHRDNLTKLADYLDKLPDNYSHFNMKYFMAIASAYPVPPQDHKDLNNCGTAACAIGHGPAAGIRVHNDFGWSDYSQRVFGCSLLYSHGAEYDLWRYMFEADWQHYDNTPQGAAARIRTVLSTGVPAGWQEQRSEVL